MPFKWYRHIAVTTSALVPFLNMAQALGADVTITNARTTPIVTSTADGTAPGNVTIETAGSVVVTDAAAVTLDSNNTVSNAGNVSSTQEAGATGILISTTQNGAANALTGAVTSSGTIQVPGPGASSSLLNTPVFNAAIRLQGLGSFTGAITNSGTATVGGVGSSGILIGAPSIGNITNSGTINTTGASSAGLRLTGPVTGSIINSGSLVGTGANSIGIYAGGGVSGSITQSGTITIGSARTGDASGNTVASVPATAGIWLAGNVNQGLLLAGNGFTKAQEAADTTISLTGESTTRTFGPGPGLLVAPDGSGTPQNMVIGPQPDSTYSIVNKGNIISGASEDGASATAVSVRGLAAGGVNYTARLDGGFTNAGGDIIATAINGQATGFHVGAGGSVPVLNNAGDITVSAMDSTSDVAKNVLGTKGGNGYGVVVDQGGTLNSFSNSGNIAVTTQGPNSSWGVLDLAGSISTFTNTGKITATNDKLSPGTAIAADLSANTSGVNFTNNGTITGAVKLGSGTNTLTMSNGTQSGDVSFVGGNNTLSLTGSTLTGNIALGTGTGNVNLVNSALTGGLTFTGGTAALTSTGSRITLPAASQIRLTNGSFDSTSTVTFQLNGRTENTGFIVAGGNVTVANGAKLVPVFTGIVSTPQTVRLITAGTLTLGAAPSSLVTPDVSFVNVYSSGRDPNDANSLIINVRRKTTAEMGLDSNMAAAFEGALGAFANDTEVTTALSAAPTREGFLAGFRQLLPDATDATRQIAVRAQNLNLGAIRRRLANLPTDAQNSADGYSSAWAQALGSVMSAKPDGDQLGYANWTLGIAFGFDTALSQTTKAGLSFSSTYDMADLRAPTDSDLIVSGSHINLYARQDLGPFYLQGIGEFGFLDYERNRNIAIGTVRRTTTGKGNGHQYGAAVELGTVLGMGAYMLEPYVRVSYVKLSQDTFTETGGGTGIDLVVDAHDQSSLRGSTGFSFGRAFKVGFDSSIEATLRGNYSREFRNTTDVFTSAFAGDGTRFTSNVLTHGPNFYSAGFSIGRTDSYSSFTLDYDSEAVGKLTSHTATISVRFRL